MKQKRSSRNTGVTDDTRLEIKGKSGQLELKRET